jgi:tetratricopeptide (TPR) repeat protein
MSKLIQITNLLKKGAELNQQGNFEEALIAYDQVIIIKPDDAEAYYYRGMILCQVDRFEEALISFDQAIVINPNHAGTFNNRGVALKELSRFNDAIDAYNKAIAIEPTDAHFYYNRGYVLQKCNHFNEAAVSYEQSIAIKPDYVDAYNNLANTFREIKEFKKAFANYDFVIALKPDHADAHFNKSLLLLLIGNYEEGWRFYEWRWKQKYNINSLRIYKQPLWLGNESLTNKTLLIYMEQGLGDYIQFIRYALLVQKLGVKVILEVPSILISVVATLKGQFTLVETGKPLPDFDYHCPVASLPLAFKTTLKSIPGELPYLYANENCKKKWGKKLGKKTITRIGLVWAGNPDHTNDYNRSLLLKQFSSLLTLPFEFHSLQKDLREVDAQTLIDFPDLYQHQDELHDFSDTAALIDAMDIIISVDTSVAHLAGAMGKKLWLLLPYLPDFRWMLDREDSPWYPCAILYRQKKINDWDSALEKLKADLLKLTN